MEPETQNAQNSALAQDHHQLQMCELPEEEAQASPCQRPNLSSSCDAVVAPACTSTSDDAVCVTTSDFEEGAPFSIRGYAAAVREINISKCWPFSRQLLEESIQEGKHPLLPPISPCACPVKVVPELYQDGTAECAPEDMSADDGPQLQVQIDLSRCDAEIDSEGCATAACAPARPMNLSLETTRPQEPQEPCTSILREEAAKKGNFFGDCPLVFKRQAPRSIREIRNSVMQGCQCNKTLEVAEACKQDICSKSPMLPPTADGRPSGLQASDEHSHDGQPGCLIRKGFGNHENVSGITQLEPSREAPHENKDACLQAGSSQPTGKMQGKDDVNEEPVMFGASRSPASQVNGWESATLGKDIHVYSRGDIMHRRCLASNSQNADKSHENHYLRSTHSRRCWDMTLQQELADTITCVDNAMQQKCPICLLFQSSSNTALNVHIDRCLASLSMEDGTTNSKQKVRVRKKRSMAELCLVAPSSIVGCENLNENLTSDFVGKSQKPLTKAPVDNEDKTTQKQNELHEPESNVHTLKLLQWGSRSSSRHGASRRGPIQEARTGSMNKRNFQSKTLEWRTSSMLQNTRKWKRQKTNQVAAEQPKNDEENTQKLRKLQVQRDKEVQNQITGKDANQREHYASQSLIKKLTSKLHGRALSKRKTAALRAVLLSSEKHSSKTSKEASQFLTLDARLNVLGSLEASVEAVHTDNVVSAESDKGDKTREGDQLHEPLHLIKRRNNKCKQTTGADLQEALDLQLAIMRDPSISCSVSNAKCQSMGQERPLDQHPVQAQLGTPGEALEVEILGEPNLFQRQICHAGNSRRIAEEQSTQDPSLHLLSTMMEDHEDERRKLPDCRNAQVSSTISDTPCLTCTDDRSNNNGISECFKIRNDTHVSFLPLESQPNSELILRKKSDAWHSPQKETDQGLVRDSEREKISQLLSTTVPYTNNVSMQHPDQIPFSLAMTRTPCQTRQLEEQNLTTAGLEAVHSSVPIHFMKSLEVARRTLGASFPSEGFRARQERPHTCMNHTGRQISSLQKHTESHLHDPGSTRSVFRRDVEDADIRPFPGSSTDNTWKASNRSQKLPPWMEAAIRDRRSPAISSLGLPTNSSSQSFLSNPLPNTSPEMPGTLSTLERIESPVLRLMGKTVLLMPDITSGHNDINTRQLSGQSMELEEGACEAMNHLSRSQGHSLQMQQGAQPVYMASDELICSERQVQSWASSESRPRPQLQDFFSTSPSTNQVPWARKPTSFSNITEHIAEPNQPMHSKLCSAMSYRAQLNWQHQKAAKTPLLWPLSSLCCSHNQERTNLEFPECGAQCSSSRATPTIPQPPRNPTHNANNVNAGKPSNLSSWFATTVNTGVKTFRQPRKVIILDEESPLYSLNMSASGSVQSMATHPKQPELSAAQRDGMPAERRRNLQDSCRPARQRQKDKTFIPIIYTVDGSSVMPPIIPAIIGTNMPSPVITAHEQRQMKSHGSAKSHLRKRASCVEQPRDGAKHMKASQAMPPALDVGARFHHDKACSEGSPNCPADLPNTASVNALHDLANEQMENTALNGSTNASERNNRIRKASSLLPKQNAREGEKDSNVSKKKRLEATAVGVCSINMNPAEVDCQDAGQFTVTPAIDISPEPSPAYDARPYIDTGVSMFPHHPARTGKANWPLLSSTFSSTSAFVAPSSRSHPAQNALLQPLHKRLASKLKSSSFPVKYDSPRPPSFFVTIPMINQPGTLQSEGMPSPATRPSFQASTSSQQMNSFKAARRFVIMNGRVSTIDTQTNTHVSRQDRRPMHTQAMNGQSHANETDGGARGENGNTYIDGVMR